MSNRVIVYGLATIAILLIIGTIFYSVVESLSLLDAFYFAGSTLTTLGYGDIVPQKAVSKIFTVFYTLIGIGIIFYVFTELFRKIFSERKN